MIGAPPPVEALPLAALDVFAVAFELDVFAGVNVIIGFADCVWPAEDVFISLVIVGAVLVCACALNS